MPGDRFRVMFWAAVGWDYKSPLLFAYASRHDEEGNFIAYKKGKAGFNNQAYSGILRRGMEPAVKKMQALHGSCIVLEDGAPPHKGPHVRKVREEVVFNNLTHPGNSPDLNAIETVWRKLKSNIKKQIRPVRSVKELLKVSYQAWDAIDQSYINKVIATMPQRYQELQEANGLYTRF
ncbi:hypothetical protein CF326_g5992 [Tilletia indica]|nr:hypothetical protein CF326_g5992 [Tilletia indica]